MASYQVVLVDEDGRGLPYKTNMSAKLLVFFCLLLMLLAVVLVSVIAANNVLSKQIAEEEAKSLPAISYEAVSILDTVTTLERGINAVYYSDIFAIDIFQSPAINNYSNYTEFTKQLTEAKVYLQLMKLYDEYNETNAQYLLTILDKVDNELLKRVGEYSGLIFNLRQREVIAAHTPNIWPVGIHHVTSRFGFRRSPITGVPSFHEGVDIGVWTGTRVATTADGVVVFAGTRSGYGQLVTVDHGFGFMTRYAHNSKLLVKNGDIVNKGDIIALSGSSGRSAGPHLHYEVLYYGTPLNALKFIPGYN